MAFIGAELPSPSFSKWRRLADAVIRINYGHPSGDQTGRLFLPFDAAIGRNLTDKLAMSLEVWGAPHSRLPGLQIQGRVQDRERVLSNQG
jgi:hypothetical protein